MLIANTPITGLNLFGTRRKHEPTQKRKQLGSLPFWIEAVETRLELAKILIKKHPLVSDVVNQLRKSN